MPLFGKTRGAKKSKVNTFIQGRSGKWHRIDPTNGQRTACGVIINDTKWGFPTEKVPGPEDLMCSWPECRGNIPPAGM